MDLVKAKEELRQMAPGFAAQVQPVYQLLGWTWRPGTKPFVPQVSHITDTLLDLIEGIDEALCSESTGGLEVFYTEPTSLDLCGCYGFRFKIEDCVFWGQGGKSRLTSGRRRV